MNVIRFVLIAITMVTLLSMGCSHNIPKTQSKLGDKTEEGVDRYWDGEISEEQLNAGVNAINSTIGELSNAPAAAGEASKYNRMTMRRDQRVQTNSGSRVESTRQLGDPEPEDWWLQERWTKRYHVRVRAVVDGRTIVEFEGKGKMAQPPHYRFHNGVQTVGYQTQFRAEEMAKELARKTGQ